MTLLDMESLIELRDMFIEKRGQIIEKVDDYTEIFRLSRYIIALNRIINPTFKPSHPWPAEAFQAGWIRAEDALEDGGHDVRIAIKMNPLIPCATEVIASVDGGKFDHLAIEILERT